MTPFRYHYENDATYLFCSKRISKKELWFISSSNNKAQHTILSSICPEIRLHFPCFVWKPFEFSFTEESSKRHYPYGKNSKLLPPINERLFWKIWHFYKARTHSLTTFGLPAFYKIVSCTFFFKLKQFLVGAVIYPTEFVF